MRCAWPGPATRLPDLGAQSGWMPIGSGLWQASVKGRYQTGNDRTDIENVGPRSMVVEWDPPASTVLPGGLATPTTPAYWDWGIRGLEPVGLEPLIVHGNRDSGPQPQVERVELLWRGRVVHRTQMEYDADLEEYEWEQRSADDWDNCLNPEYLASIGRYTAGPADSESR